jgi:hypothetical protein
MSNYDSHWRNKSVRHIETEDGSSIEVSVIDGKLSVVVDDGHSAAILLPKEQALHLATIVKLRALCL